MKVMITMILMMVIIIVITIAIMIMMIEIILIIAVVIINSPFQPGDFSTGSTAGFTANEWQRNCYFSFFHRRISLRNFLEKYFFLGTFFYWSLFPLKDHF